MATHIWQSQDGAWDNVASWSSGAVPAGVGTDTVLFTGASQYPVTSGLDNNAVDLVLLRIQPEYTGDIGNEQNPLKISADKLVNKGTGILWYSAGAATTNLLIVNTPTGHGYTILIGGALDRLQIVRGKVFCVAGMGTIATINLSTNAAYLDSGPGMSVISAINMAAGSVRSASAVVAMLMRGGHCVTRGLATSTAWVQSGGVTIDRTQNATLGSLYLVGGVYDTTKQIQGARTITNAYIWPKGDFRYVEDRITITNLHDMTGDGLTQAV